MTRARSAQLTSPLEISIESYVDEKSFTEYMITTRVAGFEGMSLSAFTATTRHRYSDFVALHTALGLDIDQSFFVPKRWFHTAAVKAGRQTELEEYLQKLPGSQGLSPPNALFDFLLESSAS